MKNRNIADIGVILYISLLIIIGINIGAARQYAPSAERPDSRPIVTSESRWPLEK